MIIGEPVRGKAQQIWGKYTMYGYDKIQPYLKQRRKRAVEIITYHPHLSCNEEVGDFVVEIQR